MLTCAEQIAAFACRLRFEDLPPEVVADAKVRWVDTLGVCLLSTRLDFAPPVVGLVREQGGRPEATLLGLGDRVPASQAALVNGTLAHGAEYDDTHPGSGIHPSCYVVTTALSAAERQGAGGRAALTAGLAGSEFAIRLGHAGVSHASPFHPTGVSGAFAATLVAGKIFGLDEAQLASALGIAGSQAAGTWKFLEDGSWIKRLHGGWPGHCGITAALLAQRGFTGPHGIFEGHRGALDAYTRSSDGAERLTADLGKVWETPTCTFKAYPCCSLTQAAMDAARALQRRHGLRAEDIAAVTCFVPPEAHRVTCEPRDLKLNPRTTFQAFFSLPYAVALALLDDDVTTESFEEARRYAPEVRGLAQRVTGAVDPALDVARFQPARVVITARDGRKLEHSIGLRGSPGNPFTRPDVERKFRGNAEGVLPPERVSALLEMLWRFEEVADVRELTALCAPATALV